MDLFWHILDRFCIHLFSSMGAIASAFFGFRVLVRRNPHWGLSQLIPDQLVFCCLIILIVAFIREPYDVSHTIDPWWKSYFDFASWVIGCGVSYWGISRLIKLDWK